ncbi:hypothetical protein DFP74_5738 [Nocardiopsis sp. Huas11]|uniref:hypothetical protein n=1 Tax=Nocardiopsis sp. Huas11 TaxID=2183912 RepID=UPI000F274AE5|nr:hypothetical protein [Nocardiopsis sp. Huas11]RKS09992.1 hypothetical protein DFP74_5738 [Nocardiopsis sp. Huas11]
MTGLIIAVAVFVTVALPVFLVAATGGPVTVFAEHDLPEPARHPRRAPKEG